MQKEKYQSQLNQNFGTVCHTEVCPSFSRLAAKLSEIITKFRGRNLKIQIKCSLTSTGLTKIFEYSLKSMQIFQVLIGGMNFREKVAKKNKCPQQ